jgi:ferritin-like protein
MELNVEDTKTERPGRRGLRPMLVAAGAAAGMTLAGLGIAQAQTGSVGTENPAASGAPADPAGPGPDAKRGPKPTLAAAATALGISEADLKTALQSGQSLAQIAQAKGVDPNKVIDALVNASKAELADQVKAGTITQAQADARAATLTQRLTEFVNNPGGPGGPGRHGPGERGLERGDNMTAAANTIGVSKAELLAALKSGQSIAQVAQSKGVDVNKVITAIIDPEKAELAVKVQAGTITQAESDRRLAIMTERVTAGVNRPGGPGQPGRGEKGPGPKLSVAATALGISEADLKTALQSGQSLAQIAQTKGVDVNKVIDALVADARADLAAKVKAGAITQAQADERAATLTQRVTDMVNHTGPLGGPDGKGPGGQGGRGPRGPKGPAEAPATGVPGQPAGVTA